MKYSEKDIAAAMSGLVESNEMAGAALIVRKHAQIVYQGKWGYADIGSKKPAEMNTIYRLASMSKPITAMAVMQLAEQGKVGLDDPIAKRIDGYDAPKVCAVTVGFDGVYAPTDGIPAGLSARELLEKMKYVPAKRPVTIRDLLTHSSGLGQGMVGHMLSEAGFSTCERLADRVRRWSTLPLDFQPGEGTGYSPMVGFDILGRIVEIVSGSDYASYLAKNLFEPLGIRDIASLLDDEQKQRQALLYTTEEGRQFPDPEADSIGKAAGAEAAGYYSGAGGLYGTASDYDKITSLLANCGQWDGVRLLQKETVALMHERSRYRGPEMIPGGYWGLGMMVFEQPERMKIPVAPGTYGWSGAYGTHMFIAPNKNICATFMMNRTNIGGAGSPIARKVEELVFGAF